MQPHIIHHLAQDPVLQPLLESLELPEFDDRLKDVYANLVRAIVFQQLSVKAASTIYHRFLELFPSRYPAARELVALNLHTLRSAGLSRQKASYVQNIARFFLENNLKDQNWETLDDRSVLELLTQIKGVGRWTAEMILIFTLQRPDVFPSDDLGIRQSIINLYSLPADLPARELRKQLLDIARPWRPYRSYACLYLWRWKDRSPQ